MSRVLMLLIASCFISAVHAKGTNEESIRSMNHALGRLQAIPAVLSAVIPFCSNEVTNQKFFKVFGMEFLDRVPPVIGSLMAIDYEYTERRYSKAVADLKKKMMTDLTTEGYETTKQNFLKSDVSHKQVCETFKSQILNGEWSLVPHVQKYFNYLKLIDIDTYNESKKLFDLMQKVDRELREKALRI